MSLPIKPGILIVNDDPASLLAFASLLRGWADELSYTVVTADCGEAALRAVLQHELALILMDVNMPGMDGFDTAAAIQTHPRGAEVPIIFVTAFAADDLSRLKAYHHRAADFLFTPVIPQVLRAKVNVFVSLAIRNEELQRQSEQLDLSSSALALANANLAHEISEHVASNRASQAKDEFLAMLSHELRNPLSAIRSASALLNLPNTSPEILSRAVQVIRRQTGNLQNMVDEVLDMSRALSGKITLACSVVDLAEVVAAVFQSFESKGRTGAHDIQLELTRAVANLDREKVEKVVMNLIDNALKYTPPGGRITIATDALEGDVQFTVTDSGVGMPAELLSRIFEVFAQDARSLDRSQGGLGIGLSYAKHIAKLHGGSISARSDGPRTGSMFRVTLPVARETAFS